jgi:hypothetical protein
MYKLIGAAALALTAFASTLALPPPCPHKWMASRCPPSRR